MTGRTATSTVLAGMLGGMTSLAFAVRSVPALSPSFNANFYIAAAIVIPVLFLERPCGRIAKYSLLSNPAGAAPRGRRFAHLGAHASPRAGTGSSPCLTESPQGWFKATSGAGTRRTPYSRA